MSGQNIGIEGYEPGNGYQPPRYGLSLREFLIIFVFVSAIYWLRKPLEGWLGDQVGGTVLGLVLGAALVAFGMREAFNSERGEETGIEVYEPGGGNRPIRPSLRAFLKFLLCMAAYFTAIVLLSVYVGGEAVTAFSRAVLGLVVVYMGAHQTLNAERFEETESARRIRGTGIGMIMFGTAIATLAARSTLFLAAGW